MAYGDKLNHYCTWRRAIACHTLAQYRTARRKRVASYAGSVPGSVQYHTLGQYRTSRRGA
eukprot:3941991-Rhodomonas_salina.1